MAKRKTKPTKSVEEDTTDTVIEDTPTVKNTETVVQATVEKDVSTEVTTDTVIEDTPTGEDTGESGEDTDANMMGNEGTTEKPVSNNVDNTPPVYTYLVRTVASFTEHMSKPTNQQEAEIAQHQLYVAIKAGITDKKAAKLCLDFMVDTINTNKKDVFSPTNRFRYVFGWKYGKIASNGYSKLMTMIANRGDKDSVRLSASTAFGTAVTDLNKVQRENLINYFTA